MNIFDLIQPNPFLSSIYPNGIVGEILVGNIEFTSGGNVFLTIHTKNCPQKEVKKWGEFGKNYNTVSLKLSVYNAESTSISGWYMADFLPIEIKKQENVFLIRQFNSGFHIEITAEYFIFQSCDVYLDEN